MLVVFLGKQIITLKLQKLKINLTIIIMVNILLLQSLILLAADVFNARSKQANVIAKTNFGNTVSNLKQNCGIKLRRIKQKTSLLEQNFKSLKRLI